MASNAKVGEIVLVIAVSIFLYYFFWVSILPFMLIDEGKFSIFTIIYTLRVSFQNIGYFYL